MTKKATKPIHSVCQSPYADFTSVSAAVKRFAVNSSIYLVGNVVTRGATFILMLVFTRDLTPSDYGILAITTTITALLSMLLGLALDSAITQMYFNYESPEEHRSLFGTLLAFWVVVPGIGSLLIDVMGQLQLLDFFPDVPFQPYLRIAIWTAYFSIFANAAQTIYLTLQKPVHFVSFALASSLLTTALAIYLVVYLREGAMGSLLATLISSGVMALAAILLSAQMVSWQLSWQKLKTALAFSLPLVPHTASNDSPAITTARALAPQHLVRPVSAMP